MTDDTEVREPATRADLIERRVDRAVTATTMAGNEFGGLRVQNMLEVMEMSKLMSLSKQAVPAHLRENPGMCLAVCLTALEWKMSPFAVANKTYVTNDRLNYESQLVHAVIEARAPLKERLKVRYEGEGLDRVCIVSGTFRGESEARDHRSPPLKECLPPRNDYGKIKGSPLWEKKPDVQMFYDTSRDWIRIYAPDVLLGIYTPDEVEQYEVGNEARDITPDPGKALHERLKAASKGDEGFRDGVVEAGLASDAPKPRGRPRKATTQATDPNSPQTQPPSQTAADDAPPVTPDSAASSPATLEQDGAGGDAFQTISEAEFSNHLLYVSGRATPTTAAEYLAYCRAWIDAETDPDRINTRYEDERDVRDALGVTIADRNALVEYAKARVEKLAQ